MHTMTRKSQIDLEKRLKSTEKALDIVVSENVQLKDQYDLLQENFHKLCQFKGHRFLQSLIYKI